MKLDNFILVPANVSAIILTMCNLDLWNLFGGRLKKYSNLIQAMIVFRILFHKQHFLKSEEFEKKIASKFYQIDDYSDSDWDSAKELLCEYQDVIEQKLAFQHLNGSGSVFYSQLTGNFRDKFRKCSDSMDDTIENGNSIVSSINNPMSFYAVLTNTVGCPVAVEKCDGNVSNVRTLLPVMDNFRQKFNIQKINFLPKKSLLTSKNISVLETDQSLGWLSALEPSDIFKLGKKNIRLEYFDDKNLFEFTASEQYPNERLIAYLNYEDAERRRFLLKCYVAPEAISELEKICVLRTSKNNNDSPEETLGQYFRIARMQKIFQTHKKTELVARDNYDWNDKKIRGHLIFCLLASYVEFHVREAWKNLVKPEGFTILPWIDYYTDKCDFIEPVRSDSRFSFHEQIKQMSVYGHPFYKIDSTTDENELVEQGDKYNYEKPTTSEVFEFLNSCNENAFLELNFTPPFDMQLYLSIGQLFKTMKMDKYSRCKLTLLP